MTRTATPKFRIIKAHWERATDLEDYIYAQIDEHLDKIINFYADRRNDLLSGCASLNGKNFIVNPHRHGAALSATKMINSKSIFVFENNRMRSCAGKAWPTYGVIAINSEMYDVMDPTENDNLRQTLLHELCHILTPNDHHGKLWKESMGIFGLEPRRCHDNEMPNRRTRQKFEVSCDCGKSYKVTQIILKRANKGYAYRCHCKRAIDFSEVISEAL